jgi:hypothetical protein
MENEVVNRKERMRWKRNTRSMSRRIIKRIKKAKRISN